jgi:CubicO group peptidase (beta-lactamase class C family)
VTAYYNNMSHSELTWPQLVDREIFVPLNMTHSFFGALPLDLIADIGVPGGANWADLIVGLGYDPAAGMWVSESPLELNFPSEVAGLGVSGSCEAFEVSAKGIQRCCRA